jgi:hypothetical protein
MMRNYRKIVTCLFVTLFGVALAAQGQDNRLADIYKTGRVCLVEEVRITDSQLPKNVLFENPRGLAIAANGNVYMTDVAANHIKVFSPDGKFLRTLGQEGQGPGDLGGPESIEIVGDFIIVREVMTRRISVVKPDGTFVKSAPFSPDDSYGRLLGLKSLRDGRLIVFVERGLPKGFSGRLPEEQDLAIKLLPADLGAARVIYEKKIRASRWAKNPETNAFHRVRFPYHPKICLGVDPSGRLAIGDNSKYEIEIYDPDKGRILTFSRPYTPVKLEDKDKKAYFDLFQMAVFVDNVKKILPKPPDYIVQLTEFPEFLPPYRGLIFDSEGNLWVHLYTQSRATNVFDVFSPKGEFVHQIIVEGAPIDASFTYGFGRPFAGSVLWQIERDKDGFASLVKYRLTAEK